MKRLFGLSLILVYVYAKVDYTGHRLISIQAKNAEELEFLRGLEGDTILKLDFWTEPSLMKPADINVPPTSYGRLRRALVRAGIEFEVKNKNIQELIDIEARSMMGRSTYDIAHRYLRFDEITAFVNSTAATYGTVSWKKIGSSYEGRDLIEVKIAQDPGRSKPAVYIECGTHAREWLSISTCLNLIKTLATDGTMLGQYDWYIVPCHNPDGYEYTHSSDERLWRKNRQLDIGCDENHMCCTGTDLNRNWDVNFGGTGTSSDQCYPNYHGLKPFSAPETRYLRDAIIALTQTGTGVAAFISFHSYSKFLLVPYAYTSVRPSDADELKCVANKMVKALADVYGTTYLVGTPGDLLNYNASGGAYDWTKLKAGIKYSYTYELRPGAYTNVGGFIQPVSEIKPTAVEIIASLREFAKMSLPCRP